MTGLGATPAGDPHHQEQHLLNILPNVSRETLQQLHRYVALIKKWQRVQNLIAPSTLHNIWQRHIADSAQILTIIPRPDHIIDLGSGAGFPGMLLAILLNNGISPPPLIELIEANRRKAVFLSAVKRELSCNVSVHCQRIETFKKVDMAGGRQLLICSRALAPLPILCSHAHHLAGDQAVAIFHKGQHYRDELAHTHRNWKFDLQIHQNQMDKSGILLQLSHIRPVK